MDVEPEDDDPQNGTVFLPFSILVLYMKNGKYGLLSECENNFIDDLIVVSFNSLSVDSKFVWYLINESCFIDSIMSEMGECVASLPSILDPVDVQGNFNIYL